MAQNKPAPGTRSAPRDDDRLARFRRMPKVVRIVYARPRFFIAFAVGLLAVFLLPATLAPTTRLLVGWDIALALYLALAYTTIYFGARTSIRHIAATQDDGRFLVLALTSIAAFASLAAIVFELAAPHRGAIQLALAVTTILMSWIAIHTTFALHYAHEYYRGETAGGLAFPGGRDDPDYWDFVYFSFVIGMTAQVSDVGITDRMIRRTATAHGITSFKFNTALLARRVNIAASAL
jgi:uncharacterized membrane protein